MKDIEAVPRSKKWRLSRAALYGFILATVTFVVHNLVDGGEELSLFWRQARPGQIIGDLIGEFSAAPLLFVAIAFVHNLFVGNSHGNQSDGRPVRNH
jgi:hypothetical protein